VRLALLIDTLDVGGTELNALRVATRLHARGLWISVCHLQPTGPLLPRFHAAGIPTWQVPRVGHPIRSLASAGARLGRWLGEECVTILHSQDVYSNLVAAWARRSAPDVRFLASRRWWHADYSILLRAANTLATMKADAVVTNASSLARRVRRRVLPRTAVHVIPNFVEPEAFASPPPAELAAWRERLGLSGKGLLVGVVARLDPIKGHRTLLRAVALLREGGFHLRLALAGDGPERAALAREADQLGLREVVHFLGTQPHRPNLHYLFDISVHCSLSEAFPNALLEAMAAGRPIVATAVGGVPDLIQPNATGLLVPRGDAGALAVALEYVCRDPHRTRAMAEAARREAARRFGEDVVMEAWWDLYAGSGRPGGITP
jgi:L-malate glycosyltransferase